MFLETVILAGLFLGLGELFRPKPKNEAERPAGLGDFQLPTATEGRPVPLVWGTVKLSGPNVIWYGDLRNEAITSKVKTGIFTSTRVTTGYRYYIGIQSALCRGPVDEIRRIWVGDEVLSTTVVSSDGGIIPIDEPNFFGGEESGSGGMVGTFRFHRGTALQAANSYLAPFQTISGDQPAYRGTCYVVWEGGLIGTSPQIKNWTFEVRRIPNGLVLPVPSVNGGNDANPMNVLYEIIVNREWGLAADPSSIDTANFVSAANTLLDEGNGFSFVLDSTMKVSELIKEIERQIDGSLYLDRATNKWKVNLARGGYSVPSLTALNDDNVESVNRFYRGSWDDTTNEVLLNFNSRARDYFGTYARAQDPANVRIQGNDVVTAEQNFPGVKDPVLSNNLVWRSLRALAYPLARAELTTNRVLYGKNVGDVVRFSSTKLGVVDLPMRIAKMNLGRLAEGKIEVSLIEDVFKFDTAGFAAPPGGLWTTPSLDPQAVPAIDSLAFAAPRAFCNRAEVNPGTLDRVWSAALHVGVNAYSEIHTRPTGVGSYTVAGNLGDFATAGTLAVALGQSDVQGSVSMVVDCNPSSQSRWLANFRDDATPEDVGVSLVNFVYVNGEWFGFRNISPLGPTQVTLSDGYRGVLDFPIIPHSTGERVWLAVGNITDRAFTGSVDVKLLPGAPGGVLPEASATNIGPVGGLDATSTSDRARFPYPPSGMRLNSVLWQSTVDLDGITTGSTIDTRGVAVSFDRRDYRATDEVQTVAMPNLIDGNFAANTGTQYQLEVRRRPVDGGALLLTYTWNVGGNLFNVHRTSILRVMPGGVVPAGIETRVFTRHNLDGLVRQNPQSTNYVFNLTSNYQGKTALGSLANGVGSAAYTATTTGTHVVTIGAALGGAFAVEFRINAGAWTTVFSGGATSGNVVLTSGDTLELRHNRNTAFETGLELTQAGNLVAYGVLHE